MRGGLDRESIGEAFPEANHLVGGLTGGDEGGVDGPGRGPREDHRAPDPCVLAQGLVDPDLERAARATAGQHETDPWATLGHASLVTRKEPTSQRPTGPPN